MAKIILFDFDGTLFNSKKLAAEMANEWEKNCHISLQVTESVFNNYSSSLTASLDFNPEDFIISLSQETNVDREKIAAVLQQEWLYQEAIFDQADKILVTLKKKYQLGIFSQGVGSWQKLKMEKSRLLPLFEQDLLFITRRKTTLEFLQTLPEDSVIIDDNLAVIEDLVKFGKFKVFWIDRYGNQQMNFKEVQRVTSLAEFVTKLEN